jgi:hypothetical protein
MGFAQPRLGRLALLLEGGRGIVVRVWLVADVAAFPREPIEQPQEYILRRLRPCRLFDVSQAPSGKNSPFW